MLFLLYVNDISNISKILHFVLFADDTNIFLSDHNTSQLFQSANQELKHLTNWFLCNRLSVNISKSNFIVFSSPKVKLELSDLKITLNNQVINRVPHAKFLGVYIDEHLNWNEHINQLSLKLAKNNGILSKIKHIIPNSTMLTLYNSFILPYLSYCNRIWCSASLNKINKINIAQKRALRTVANVGRSVSTKGLFKKFKVLKITDIHKFQTLQLIYKFHNHLLPATFNNYFTPVNKIHGHFTRNSMGLNIPFARTNCKKESIRIAGPRMWNTIPHDIQISTSLHSFNRNLKAHILETY